MHQKAKISTNQVVRMGNSLDDCFHGILQNCYDSLWYQMNEGSAGAASPHAIDSNAAADN